MKKNILFPAIGILSVTIIVIGVNEFTEITVNSGFGYMLIISAMLFGVWLSKRSRTNK